jgi:hypothetical protein
MSRGTIFVLDYSPKPASICPCFGYERGGRAARKLVACVVRAKACRSDHSHPLFSPDGLALGAETILVPAIGPCCLANLQGEEARLLTLLSATFGKAISPSVLGNISRAAKSWGKGDDVAAAIYLTHAGLPRPDDPTEAARRLFVTDAFIKSGTSPIGILQALGLEASYVRTIAKLYNELELRVPSGQRHHQRPMDRISFIPRRFADPTD